MHQSRLLLRSLRALILLGFLALLPPAAAIHAAGVIYVVPGGIGTQTGADWASAKDLQAALSSSTSGDEIWVKAGSYTPTTGADRTATFQLKSGVALYGGFAGGEASRDQRDVAANVTILSGDLLGNDAGAVASTNATRGENSFHVVTVSGNTAVLAGSAIATDFSSPIISQVVFSNNQSLNGGGALSNQQSSPVIRNSIFWGNQGGEIYNYLAGNAPDVQYSLVQGGYITGTHILDADPLFVDADGADNIAGTPDDDLRLQAGSPVSDAGNNAFIPADQTDDNTNGNLSESAPFDLAGNPRLIGAAVDLGAYEWQGATIPPPKRVYMALITATKTVAR